MPDKDAGEKKEFKKRSHRPWKPNLLAKTIGLHTSAEESLPAEDLAESDYGVTAKRSSPITDNQQIIDSLADAAGFDCVEIENPFPDQAGRKKYDPALVSYARLIKLTARAKSSTRS